MPHLNIFPMIKTKLANRFLSRQEIGNMLGIYKNAYVQRPATEIYWLAR